MSQALQTRRRMIRSRGRSMVLTRQADGASLAASVTLTGFPRDYRPDEFQGGVQAGDMQIETLDDEMAAAGWPVPPGNPDRILVDGRTVTVKAARPVYDGALRIGWSIWVRG